MDTSTLTALLLACAPLVHPATAHALVMVESALNPYAIGVVDGALERQPRTANEALATVKQLRAQGWNFSVGLAQINRSNFERLRLTDATALEPCTNLAAMQTVLTECFERVGPQAVPQAALRRALSCYYSGDASTGVRHGYVDRVLRAVRALPPAAGRSPLQPSTADSIAFRRSTS